MAANRSIPLQHVVTLAMFFDTPVYFIFLAVVVPLYWCMTHYAQNIFLLCASYFFYGWWDWRFLSLIAISTIVDFYCATFIASSTDQNRRRHLLMVSLLLNLGFLGYFKYFNFFEDSFIELLRKLGVEQLDRTVVSILLPPGISFYTFQAVAYIVDVYDRKVKPATSQLDYAVFLSLFPHLIAGPIQRPSHLLPQVIKCRIYNSDEFFRGLMLILSGLFRKCVIADNCAILADAAFSGKLGAPSLPILAIGAYAFAWQIYGDFSGYSQIARGSAFLMGFDFMINFRQPYLSTSLQDFWRRWHISLSTWLRDYLYIRCLGGNRGGERRTQRNILLTMIIGGFWHGANWTFIVWGAIHGVGLVVWRTVQGWRPSVANGPQQEPVPLWRSSALPWAKRILVFHIVCLAWIFFRAPSVGAALEMLGGASNLAWRPEYGTAFLFLAAFSLPLFLVDLVNERSKQEYPFEGSLFRWQIASAAGLVGAIAFFGGTSTNAFIYFQF